MNNSIHASTNFLSQVIITIQFGFIVGALVYSIFAFADRFSSLKVFFISSIGVCMFNLALLLPTINIYSVLSFRFITGFFLAGIYPVGMKIAADYFGKNIGKSLGYLVGALVLGTAFPHLITSLSFTVSWKLVIYITSFFCLIGGSLVVFCLPKISVKKATNQFKFNVLLKIFKDKNFKSVAFGYFGHMWELYTFWAFIPIILHSFNVLNKNLNLNVHTYSFIVIASGFISCIIAGYLSKYYSLHKLAIVILALSCLCCIILPFMLAYVNQPIWIITFLIFWGMVVIADSPLLSSLVAQNAPQNIKGSALTMVNCIGFSITILSIQFLNLLLTNYTTNYVFIVLAIGPILGIIALIPPLFLNKEK